MAEGMVSLTIRYINGSEQRFEINPEAGIADQATLGSRIHKVFSSDPMIIELSDMVLMIPLHSIQNIEISPAPRKLPEGAILNARQIQG